MTRELRGLFTVTGTSTYGPRKSNPEYAVKDPTGGTWAVSRHRWTLPASSWGWKAVPAAGGKTVYGDSLAELAEELGHELS